MTINEHLVQIERYVSDQAPYEYDTRNRRRLQALESLTALREQIAERARGAEQMERALLSANESEVELMAERDQAHRQMELSRTTGCWCDEHGHPCQGCEWRQRIATLEEALRKIEGIVAALPICEAPIDAGAVKGLPVGATDSETQRKALDIAVEALLRFDDIYADEALAAIRAAMGGVAPSEDKQ